MKKSQSSRSRVASSRTFTQGEVAVVKSMLKNDIKKPLNNPNSKQKTIGAKKSTKYHRAM